MIKNDQAKNIIEPAFNVGSIFLLKNLLPSHNYKELLIDVVDIKKVTKQKNGGKQMRTEIKEITEVITKKETIYIAFDGTEFDSPIDCQKYEYDNNLKKVLDTIETAELDSPNFDGGENYESHNYSWYRPKNIEELELLANTFGCDAHLKEIYIGKWICIETDSGDEAIWSTTLDDGIEYAKAILDKLGFEMIIQPKSIQE